MILGLLIEGIFINSNSGCGHVQLKISPEKIHHLLYFATMFVGDSQTMTSEAAVLGTPAIRCNSFVGRISYLEEEEHKYGLTFGFTPDKFDNLIIKIKELEVYKFIVYSIAVDTSDVVLSSS